MPLRKLATQLGKDRLTTRKHKARAKTKLTRGLSPRRKRWCPYCIGSNNLGRVTLLTRLQELQFYCYAENWSLH
eukprot:1140917-Pelagomonas_calceolata.AAC.1